VDFSITVFSRPEFGVCSPVASLWSLLAWVVGELRAAASSQAWAWPEESRHGLQWELSHLVAAVSASKPVSGQTLGLMIFWGPLLKKFLNFFFELLWFCCLFFHMACGLRVMLQPPPLVLKLLP